MAESLGLLVDFEEIAIFLNVATSTSFINFGAFTAFTLVNAAVVFHYVRQRRAGTS